MKTLFTYKYDTKNNCFDCAEILAYETRNKYKSADKDGRLPFLDKRKIAKSKIGQCINYNSSIIVYLSERSVLMARRIMIRHIKSRIIKYKKRITEYKKSINYLTGKKI